MPTRSLAKNPANANIQSNKNLVPEPLPELRAKRIVLVDEDNHERARLHITSDNATVLSLYDQHELKMTLRVAEEDSHIAIFSRVDSNTSDDQAERIFIGYQMESTRGLATPHITFTDEKGIEALRLDLLGQQHFTDEEPQRMTATPLLKPEDVPEKLMSADEIQALVDGILSYSDEDCAAAFCRLIRAINATKNMQDKEMLCYGALNFGYQKTRHYAENLAAMMDGQAL